MKKSDNNMPEFNREREFTIVLEGLRSEFRVFAEDLTGVKKNVEFVRVNQGRTLEEVTLIKLTQRKILDTLKIHNNRLSKLEGAVLR